MIQENPEAATAAHEIFGDILSKSNARPLTPADIIRRGLVPFTFVGGPADGDVLLDGEEFTRRCHEAAGRTFDRTNPTGHGPGCLSACGDGSVCVIHQYKTDWDRRRYLYVGVLRFIADAAGGQL